MSHGMKRAESVHFLSGVLLVSRDPERLARFYHDVLGLALEPEHHDGTMPHWGTTLGDLHFAIHPVEDFPEHPAHAVGSVKLAFHVFDLASVVERLRAMEVPLLYPIRDTGFFLSAAIRDPDGNFVELTQLCDAWFKHLEERRAEGKDVVAAWQAARSER